MHGAISHTSRRPPDVILHRSFTRPSTALGDRKPGDKTNVLPGRVQVVSFPDPPPVLKGGLGTRLEYKGLYSHSRSQALSTKEGENLGARLPHS